MRRTFAAATLLALSTLPALAIEPPDGNRYPGWHNRMQGYQAVREPRWAVKRQRVVRKAAKPKRVLASPRRAPVVPQMGHTRHLLSDGARAFSAPARFIGGRLICAINVNAALAEKGIRGTGSALAKSFLRWGRPSGPVPGAVAVYNRGRNARSGHVAIVARVERGRVLVWNPSRRGWRLIAYRKRAIAYRVAS